MSQKYLKFLLVGLAGLILFCPLRVRAADTISQRRETLSDTQFVSWLEEYSPAVRRLKLKRYKLLGRSHLLPAEARLDYLRRGTQLAEKLIKPRLQIRLALQLERRQLAREWLDRWQDRELRNVGAAKKLVDMLVNNREFDWTRQLIRKVQEEFDRRDLMYRRLALTYTGSGDFRGALDVYLRAARRRGFPSYLRSRLLGLVRKAELGDYFLERLQEIIPESEAPQRFLELAVDYLLENRDPAALVQFLEAAASGDETARLKRLRKIRDRLIGREKYTRAREIARVVVEKYSPEPSDLIALGRLRALENQPEAALTLAARVDTAGLAGRDRAGLLKLKLRSRLLLREDTRVRELLNDRKSKTESRELRLAYYRYRHQYDSMLRVLEATSQPAPWWQFYARFMTGNSVDTPLGQLVEQTPEARRTAVALAIAGWNNKDNVRKFYRWLDSYPLNSGVDTAPPAELGEGAAGLPRLLLEEWSRRLALEDLGADTLAGWGRTFSYPRLLLQAARKYKRAGDKDSARSLLEEILVGYPESVHRFRAEKILDSLS